MKISNTSLPEVLLIEPKVLNDNRGFFFELWNRASFQESGIPNKFAQDNVSFSRGGVLRGLHFQHPRGQGKLISVLVGEIFDVAVDVRPNSPNFKKWVGVNLSEKNHHQLWIPEGFAHGFFVLSDTALVSYKATDFYCPQSETTVLWNDPDISIQWPEGTPDLSDKDRVGTPIAQIPPEKLPKF